ncbi:AMP-binding protein [Catenulispora sp. NF23]|uniref:AMP-binding protein n=1 Tax=Catenulispora pinistramenti TaxID=2705254 RepID=UPI001BA84EE9|nr:AMP-binding protein [Catenulispora pinistramenti]MBS2532038.1 AMP-binding protein [Catenulispora pinistramenti]
MSDDEGPDGILRMAESEAGSEGDAAAHPRFCYEHVTPGPPDVADPLAAVLRTAAEDGTRPAVTDWTGTFDYRLLAAHTARIARRLRAAGIGPGDAVVLHLPLNRWAVPAMLGVLATGAQYIPVDTALPVRRRMALIQASAAAAVVVESAAGTSVGLDGFAHVVEAATAPDGEPADPSDPEELSGFTPEPVAPGSPAYTLYTSGSSGRPKGVVVSRGSLGYSTQARIDYYPPLPPTYLLCSSISFDSSVAGIYWPLAAGGHIVIPSANPMDIEQIAQACSQYGGTHMAIIPSLYRLLLETESQESDGTRLDTLRVVIVAGEVFPPPLVALHAKVVPHATAYNEYGPTECTVWSTVHECTNLDAGRERLPIGRPIPGTGVHVEPVEDGQPGRESDSLVGELWLSGPGVALGYAEAVEPSPFATVAGVRMYRTGDLVSVDASGALSFLSRRDTQVKLAGARIELGEIEHLLSAAVGAGTAAVGVARRVSGPGETGEISALIGFVAGADGLFDPAAVRRDLMRRLPRAAVPRLIVPVPALPRLPNGKTDREALDRMVEQMTDPHSDPRPADDRATEHRPADRRAPDERATESRAPNERPADSRAAEQRAAR